MEITNNRMIQTLTDQEFRVIRELGEGGQGKVYLVSYKGNQYALKLYKNKPSEDFIFNLKKNISNGSPSNSFLWPLEYVEIDEDTCGYLMNIRPNNYVSFISYLNGKTQFKNKTVMRQNYILSKMCKMFNI